MKDVAEQLDNMEIEEQINLLDEVIKNPDYEEDPYTDLMLSFIKHHKKGYKISPKQKSIIRTHLLFKSRFWY